MGVCEAEGNVKSKIRADQQVSVLQTMFMNCIEELERIRNLDQEKKTFSLRDNSKKKKT